EADDGEILMEQLKKTVPDILLLDIRMPQIDGIEALPMIKLLYPTVKIIMLSMYDDQFTIRKMMDLGANGYLTKTAEPEEIILAIQACMNDELYINEVLVSSVLTQLRQKREYAGRYFLPVKF
ncbi:MAG: response regulator, partial [Chitinophagaceae bacterium]